MVCHLVSIRLRQANPLTDFILTVFVGILCVPFIRFRLHLDGVFSISKGSSTVVHNRQSVIRPRSVAFLFKIEVVCLVLRNVLPKYFDVLVTVWSLLLMRHSQGMSKLMNNNTQAITARVCQLHSL